MELEAVMEVAGESPFIPSKEGEEGSTQILGLTNGTNSISILLISTIR
jgi:hypothetical protein